jgi:hypothetical protein
VYRTFQTEKTFPESGGRKPIGRSDTNQYKGDQNFSKVSWSTMQVNSGHIWIGDNSTS